MNGPSQFDNEFSPHLVGFGFNLLMTLAIAQILVFVKDNDNRMKINPIIFGILLGLLIISMNGRDYAFCQRVPNHRPWKLFYINGAHSICQCILISTILTVF